MHHLLTSKSGKAPFTIANVLLTMNTHKHITEKLTGSKRLLIGKRVKYEDRLKSFTSSVIFFIRVMKSGKNQFHAVTYLPSTIRNLESTHTHNSGSVPVETDGCENMRFKQCAVIEFLTAEKIPPINIHLHMQAVYGDKYVDVSRGNGYGRLSEKNWRKQV